jgi:hypothetical protein
LLALAAGICLLFLVVVVFQQSRIRILSGKVLEDQLTISTIKSDLIKAIKEDDPVWLISFRDQKSAIGFISNQDNRLNFTPIVHLTNPELVKDDVEILDPHWTDDHKWKLKRAPAQEP